MGHKKSASKKKIGATVESDTDWAAAATDNPDLLEMATAAKYWKPSSKKESHLERLHERRLLPPKSIGGWEAAEDHAIPSLRPGQIVMFTHFIHMGLGFPASEFFRGFLHFYRLKLNHLCPNTILHMSIFVHLCEVYIGIPPSFTLFRYFFRVKSQPNNQNLAPLGGAAIQFRAGGKKEQYLSYSLIDSNKDWASKWFYIANVLPGLEVHGNDHPQVIPAWSEDITNAQKDEIQPYLNRIQSLKNKGLNGLAVIASWVKRWIQPLKDRVNYGFEYIGENDLTRMSKEELSEEEVLKRVKKMLKGVDGLPHPLEEFHLGRPPPKVNFSINESYE